MSGQVLAKPPAECCFTAVIHSGEPKGQSIHILDVETYVTEPEPSKANGNVVLFFPDVFGLYLNSKLLADSFAREGYLTLVVDYFKGDTIGGYLKDDHNFAAGFKEGFEFPKWAAEKTAFCQEFVPKWVAEVKSKYGKPETKFACTGYCWGATYVMNELSAKGACTAGAFAHPGNINESHMQDLIKPLLLNCAQTDMTFPTELRRKAVDILMQENKKFQVQLFQGVSHGFAVKGDISDPWQKYAMDQAFQGTVNWFNLWLA